MRIAIDARALAHPFTGIGRYTKIMTEKLSERGHDLVLCANAVKGHTGWLKVQLSVRSVVSNRNSDIYWSPRQHLPIIGVRVPTVVTVHDMVCWKVPETMRWSRRWSDRIQLAQSVRSADRVIAVSSSTRNDIVQHYRLDPDKATVIAEAPTIAPDGRTTKFENVRPYVLFVGTLEPRKNLPRLIKAFLDCGLPNHDLIIAGHQGWGNITVPKHSNLKWLSPKTDAELASLYSAAAFVAAPSLYEGFGLQVAKALAFGKAVITSNISALPEVAGNAALYVDPNSTADISRSISKLATDHILRKQLESNAKVRAQTFSWDRTVDQTVSVFESLLG